MTARLHNTQSVSQSTGVKQDEHDLERNKDERFVDNREKKRTHLANVRRRECHCGDDGKSLNPMSSAGFLLSLGATDDDVMFHLALICFVQSSRPNPENILYKIHLLTCATHPHQWMQADTLVDFLPQSQTIIHANSICCGGRRTPIIQSQSFSTFNH